MFAVIGSARDNGIDLTIVRKDFSVALPCILEHVVPAAWDLTKLKWHLEKVPLEGNGLLLLLLESDIPRPAIWFGKARISNEFILLMYNENGMQWFHCATCAGACAEWVLDMQATWGASYVSWTTTKH